MRGAQRRSNLFKTRLLRASPSQLNKGDGSVFPFSDLIEKQNRPLDFKKEGAG